MTDKHEAVQRRFTEVTEGSGKGRTRLVEVCMECRERQPKGGNNPDRVCKPCDDARKGRWIIKSFNYPDKGEKK